MKDGKAARLEDFGARGTVNPEERFEEYQEQSRDIPRGLKAKFWMEALENDPDVAEFAKASGGTELFVNKSRRRR